MRVAGESGLHADWNPAAITSVHRTIGLHAMVAAIVPGDDFG
jgi:hypothetical protein